ncbi:MAG: hypothetical protein IKZ26_04545 [Peptococcaceae bacterium]|nr:hypothetical protein [Peptococcaceae bacterium]
MCMDSILSESAAQCQAAVEWSKDLKARKEAGEKIGKQLMEKYKPMILARAGEVKESETGNNEK